MPTRRSLVIGLGLGAAGGLAGCGASRPATRASSPLVPVTYLTGYQTTAREQYARVADAKGYFRAAGLSVTIGLGQPSSYNIQQVGTGHAQFASIDFVSAVRFAAAAPFQIVSAVQQSTLLGLVSLASRRYRAPADASRKTIGVAANSAAQTLFPLYARLAGVDPTVSWAIAAPDQLPAYLGAGRIDLMATYASDAPIIQAAVRQPVSALRYSDYLKSLYGSVVIASADVVSRQNGDIARRFAAAISRGVAYATDHPEEAARIIGKALPETNAAAATEIYRQMRPYVHPAGTAPGSLDRNRVVQGIDLLVQAGATKPGQVDPDRLVAFALAPRAA